MRDLEKESIPTEERAVDNALRGGQVQRTNRVGKNYRFLEVARRAWTFMVDDRLF